PAQPAATPTKAAAANSRSLLVPIRRSFRSSSGQQRQKNPESPALPGLRVRGGLSGVEGEGREIPATEGTSGRTPRATTGRLFLDQVDHVGDYRLCLWNCLEQKSRKPCN